MNYLKFLFATIAIIFILAGCGGESPLEIEDGYDPPDTNEGWCPAPLDVGYKCEDCH